MFPAVQFFSQTSKKTDLQDVHHKVTASSSLETKNGLLLSMFLRDRSIVAAGDLYA